MLRVGDQYTLFAVTGDGMDKSTLIKITQMMPIKSGGWLMSLEMVSDNPHAIADFFVTEDQRMRLGA